MNTLFIIVVIEFVLIILIETICTQNVNTNLQDMMRQYIKEFYKFKNYLEADEECDEFVDEIWETYPENTISVDKEIRVILLIPNVRSNSITTIKNLRRELLSVGKYIYQYYESNDSQIKFKENSEKVFKEFKKCYQKMIELEETK